MTGFSLQTNFVENPEKLVRRVQPHVVHPQLSLLTSEPASQAPSTELMAEKTLRDFSVPSAANVATGPNVDVGDVNFELKSSLINMVQASPFCGKPNEDANSHLHNFRELCKTVTIRLTPSGSAYFLSPSWGRRNNGFVRTRKPSTCGTNVPWHSSLNSYSWAKPMPYVEEFQVSNG